MVCALAINLVMFALTIKEYCAVEEEARRHCERNVQSYWRFFVSPDFGFYREIYMRVSNIDQICDLQFGYC